MANILVQYNDKTRIQDLDLCTSIDNGFNIEVSTKDSNLKYTKKYNINSNLKGTNQDAENNLSKAVTKRYKTNDNDLISNDLQLFVSYEQSDSSLKELYFENHPIVDNLNTNNMLSNDQLITKSNVNEFEAYLSNKNLLQYSCIPVFNWENEWPKLNKDNINECIQDTISGKPTFTVIETDFKNFLTNNENVARATYKFLYTTTSSNKRNLERITNIVPLNNFNTTGASPISGVVHLSIAGVVSVKTDLPNQNSGTIYLEARKANKNTINDDNQWQTIDSAVFKFLNSNKSPGTFITLNGYLTTEFETRLKLNLKSQGYSMNIFEFRENYSMPVTPYVNTFIGIVHISNVRSTEQNKIYFSNINYQPYLYRNEGMKLITIDTPPNNSTVSFITSKLSEVPGNSDVTSLAVNAYEMDSIKTPFKLNGLRLSPTGRIYTNNEVLPVQPGMTIYPSYTSGVVNVKKPDVLQIVENNYPTVYNWGNGQYILNKINYTQLSVLKNIQWPKETKISSALSSEVYIHYNDYQPGTIGENSTKDILSSETVPVPGVFSISSYATDKPRRQYHDEIQDITLSAQLQGKDVYGDITCTFTAWPETWGKGSGNESYGRIYSGTNELINPHYFKTKNISRWITYGLCTGSRWSCKAQTITGTIIQPCGTQYIRILASADTGEGDGKKTTNFKVSLSNLNVSYNYKKTITINNPGTDPTGGDHYSYGKLSIGAECGINKFVYPTIIKNSSIQNTNRKPNYTNLQNNSLFNDITAEINYSNASTGNDSYKKEHTELTVYPIPQNLIF